MATGDVIGILNADDFYANDMVISKIVETFQRTGVASVYGDLAYVDAKEVSKVIRYWHSGNYRHGAFLNKRMPPHPTFFVKRDVYEKYSVFDLRLRSSADYELMLRLLHKHQVSVAYLPQNNGYDACWRASNASFASPLEANREDRMAWKLNTGLQPHFLTMFHRNLYGK